MSATTEDEEDEDAVELFVAHFDARDRALTVHEAGHAVVARALGADVLFARAKRRNGAAHGSVLVSGYKLARQFGCSRQNIDLLAQQGVIERRGDSNFNQDVSQMKYLTHLRAEHRRSPRAAADAELASANSALLRIRIEEKQRTLVRQSDVNELTDSLCGVVLTALSSLPARCARRGDLEVRRSIERVVLRCAPRWPTSATRWPTGAVSRRWTSNSHLFV